MIDIGKEKLLSIKQVCDRVPGKRGNVVYHTVWHWMRKGVSGVRLESCPVGGRIYTSEQALQRFLVELAGGNGEPELTAVPAPPSPRRTATVNDERRHERNAQEMEQRFGIKRRPD